jgi:pimeloyl-ACP methyl ester carboxylesterase
MPVQAMADDTVALLASLDIGQVGLSGCSLGAGIALNIITSHPGRGPQGRARIGDPRQDRPSPRNARRVRIRGVRRFERWFGQAPGIVGWSGWH